MHVGRMRMGVREPAMGMRMGVRLTRRIGGAVLMLMVLIVRVRMGVGPGVMDVPMLMVFAHMQPDTDAHQNAGQGELDRQRFVEPHDGGGGTQERCGREIGRRPRGAEMTKRYDEKRQTDAVTEDADDACG